MNRIWKVMDATAVWMRTMALVMLVLTGAGPALAQTVTLPSGSAPGGAIGFGTVGSAYTAVDTTHPLPVSGLQQTVQVVSANVPAPAATLRGGSYVFAQSCATYGMVTLRYRGPDGATMAVMLTRNATDSGGGTLVTLGSNAVVDATVSGTTGCNATLARVP